MGRLTKLAALAMLADVFLSALIGIGVYWGFSVYPYWMPARQAAEGITFNMTIPLWMPSIQDLRTPLTFLQSESENGIPLTIVFSLLAAVVISFVRGMYLGGMNGLVSYKSVSLWNCGRYYFKRMLGWTIISALATGIATLITAVLGPLGFAFMLILFFYSLTPYLIVLHNIGLWEALSRAPSIFRRYFRRLFSLALSAALLTLCISFFNGVPKPYNYFIVMLIYSMAGSALIRELMNRLAYLMKRDLAWLSQVPVPLAGESRLGKTGSYLLLFVLPLLGIAFASGFHLQALDWKSKQDWHGIAYGTGISEALRVSNQQYTSYFWEQRTYDLELSIPDLSDGHRPAEIRGFGHIRWNVNKDVITRISSNTTQHRIEPALVEDTFYYRLKRVQSDDGTYYYSSREGAIGTLAVYRKQHEPLSAVMTVSGDGRNVFLLQHPARFDPWQAYLVSADGAFLIPKSSQINPTDFKYHWFSRDLQKEDIFRFLQDKNTQNFYDRKERAFALLAAALQEADGNMVTRLLDAMRANEVNVIAPAWDAAQWTAKLRELYSGADIAGMLPYLTKAGETTGHAAEQLSEQDGITKYRIRVTFPDGTAVIAYTENNRDLKELTVEIEDGTGGKQP